MGAEDFNTREPVTFDERLVSIALGRLCWLVKIIFSTSGRIFSKHIINSLIIAITTSSAQMTSRLNPIILAGL